MTTNQRRRVDDRQLDLFAEMADTARQLARRAGNAMRRRAAAACGIQLALSPDWDPRECKDPNHIGSRLLPAESFVKNGRWRRSSCKCCWARAQHEREARAASKKLDDQKLHELLNRLWRPRTSAA